MGKGESVGVVSSRYSEPILQAVEQVHTTYPELGYAFGDNDQRNSRTLYLGRLSAHHAGGDVGQQLAVTRVFISRFDMVSAYVSALPEAKDCSPTVYLVEPDDVVFNATAQPVPHSESLQLAEWLRVADFSDPAPMEEMRRRMATGYYDTGRDLQVEVQSGTLPLSQPAVLL